MVETTPFVGSCRGVHGINRGHHGIYRFVGIDRGIVLSFQGFLGGARNAFCPSTVSTEDWFGGVRHSGSRSTFPILSRDPSFQETIKNPGETDPVFNDG